MLYMFCVLINVNVTIDVESDPTPYTYTFASCNPTPHNLIYMVVNFSALIQAMACQLLVASPLPETTADLLSVGPLVTK